MSRRPPPQSPGRKALVQMMGAVIVVHMVAIAVYRLGHIASRPENVGRIFGAAWTLVTLAIVLVGLYRVRTARLAGRAARRS